MRILHGGEIAEFQSPVELGIATEAILDADSRVMSARIHTNLGGAALEDLFDQAETLVHEHNRKSPNNHTENLDIDPTTKDAITEATYDLIPELRMIDETVKNWWSTNGIEGHRPLTNFTTTARIQRLAAEPHIDEIGHYRNPDIISGPIGLSLRVDTKLSVNRLYHLRGLKNGFFRKHEPTTTKIGIDQDVYDAATRAMRRTRMWPFLLQTVEQAPGDIIIFHNHPYPTIHGVSHSGPTTAVVMDHCFIPENK